MIDSLRVAVCALVQPGSFEEILVEVVNLGGDADSTGATAGGLLGARDGIAAIPEHWLAVLEYRDRFTETALGSSSSGGSQNHQVRREVAAFLPREVGLDQGAVGAPEVVDRVGQVLAG